MSAIQGKELIRDSKALAALSKAEDLQARAQRVDAEIRRLLGPLKEQLKLLLVEHEDLHDQAHSALVDFFQAVKRADPGLATHSSLRYQKEGDSVYLLWDDAGPRFSADPGAEPPPVQGFDHRGPSRRASDLAHWLG